MMKKLAQCYALDSECLVIKVCQARRIVNSVYIRGKYGIEKGKIFIKSHSSLGALEHQYCDE